MRLLTLREVLDMTGLSKTNIYERISREEFPAPLKLGRSSRWIEGEIIQHLKSMALERER